MRILKLKFACSCLIRFYLKKYINLATKKNMKKFLISLISILMLFGSLHAEPVTPEKAKQLAHHFMVQQVSVEVAHNTLKMKSASVLNTNEAELISNQQEFYIFNHGNDQGFVMRAADCRGSLMLGY